MPKQGLLGAVACSCWVYTCMVVLSVMWYVYEGDLLSMSASKQPLRKKEKVKGMMKSTSVIHCNAQ